MAETAGFLDIWCKKKAREAFADVICATAESETVYLLVEAGELDHAQMIIEAVRKEKNYQKNYPVPLYGNCIG